MIKNNIEYWTTQYREKLDEKTIDEIEFMYCVEMMSANKIGEIIGCGHNTVIRVLRNRGIETRDMSHAQLTFYGKDVCDLYNDKEWLSKMYWDEGRTTKEIADEIGVSESSLFRHFSKLGIQTKSVSDAKKGRMIGEKHHNWKGGITPLMILLREYFDVNQKPVIAKRDNYTCQMCGATHTVLNIHHIIRFADIVKEICSENSDLDPCDPKDKYELYNIITNDIRFLDEDNLITLCRDCHYFKVHNYKRKKTISSQASTEEGSETIPRGSTPEAIAGGSAMGLTFSS